MGWVSLRLRTWGFSRHRLTQPTAPPGSPWKVGVSRVCDPQHSLPDRLHPSSGHCGGAGGDAICYRCG